MTNEPNWEILLKSAIQGKHDAYESYKKAVRNALDYSFIGSEGEMVLEEGQAERNQWAMDCWKEYIRCDYEIKRIRGEIERTKCL